MAAQLGAGVEFRRAFLAVFPSGSDQFISPLFGPSCLVPSAKMKIPGALKLLFWREEQTRTVAWWDS